MYRLVILEDSPGHAEVLRGLICAYPRSHRLRIEQASSVAALEACLDEGPVDILVADIDLGPDEPTGIEVVQRLFSKGAGTQVIYVSGYVEFCTRVYRTDHLYFLSKPVEPDDLADALDKAFAKLGELEASALVVRSGGQVRLVRPGAIGYIESDRRKVRIHVGGEVIEAYAALIDMADQLPDSFVQCHKSFLVNMDHIVELRSDNLVLCSGACVPVSQKKRKATREAFFRYLGKRCG